MQQRPSSAHPTPWWCAHVAAGPPAQTDKHTAKRIAGKIIPAIATTTATVTGLVCLELYKLLQGKGLEAHRNSFLNLALPVVAMSEPLPPAKNEQGFTAWDHVDVVGPCTVKGLIDQVEAKHSVSISILSCGSAMLYSLFMPPQKQTQRLQTPCVPPMPLPSLHCPLTAPCSAQCRGAGRVRGQAPRGRDDALHHPRVLRQRRGRQRRGPPLHSLPHQVGRGNAELAVG